MEARTTILATLLAVTIVLQSSIISAATTAHVVGGSTGWTIPLNTTFYSDWASSRTIASGDTLVFNFPTGIHTVVEVPKSSYDACSTTKRIGSTINSGPATVTVTSGTHYYICGVLGHCSAGQKLAVTVAAAPSTPPTASKPAHAAAPTSVSTAPAVAPAARTVRGLAPPAATPKMSGPTTSSPVATPVPAAAPSADSPPPTAAPVAGPTTASSPAPTAAKKSTASPPVGSIPSVPSSTAIPPTVAGPLGSGNVPSSSPALRSTTTTLVALMSVVVACLLV